jgi:hypothetical protein
VQILGASPIWHVKVCTKLIGSLVVASLVSCKQRSFTYADAAGSYEYHLGNSAQGSICFELYPNGSYRLGDAKEPLSSTSIRGSQATGRWTLSGSSDEEVLLLGKSSLPIERTRLSIRVTIDDDLGIYCDLPFRQR